MWSGVGGRGGGRRESGGWEVHDQLRTDLSEGGGG